LTQAAFADAADNVIDIEGYNVDLVKLAEDDLSMQNAWKEMTVAYNNMMLQAKEAYNLGVLNGGDYEILQSVVADPTSFKGAFISNAALKKQATELSRMMSEGTAPAIRDSGRRAEETIVKPSTQSQKPMASMPPAQQHKGRTIRDTATGKKIQSDGMIWKEVQ